MTPRRAGAIDSVVLAVLSCILIGPLFRLTYLDNWKSIESTFIADARMLIEHLPHPGWQPLWYCGTRSDYIYPPALRYGTALLAWSARVPPARAYHLYIAFFYVLGIVAVYWLVRTGAGSRGAAWLAAGMTALLSPSFLLIAPIRADSGFLVPQRLHVLMTYGEGPHISALCVLPAALAAALAALRHWRPAMLALAGALSALVVANNFYGATALAVFYPILVWSVWVGERNAGVWWRAGAIPLLAWGLNAFWLTPSYLTITLTNLKWVAEPAKLSSRLVLLAAVALYCAVSLRAAARKREREWPVFVAGAVVALGIYVLGFFYFGMSISGDAQRLVPELDLALTLAFVEVARRLWTRPRLRLPVALVVALAFLPSVRYLRHAWSPFPKAAPLHTVYQYEAAEWAHEHLPDARTLPVGSLRLWFDTWADNAQAAGGSDQGMLNQTIPVATWQVLHGTRADLSILWLQALGTDAVIAPGEAAPEPYRDLTEPGKFRGALPVLHDDRQGAVVYGVPRVHPGIVRVVDRGAIDTAPQIRGGDDLEGLTKYAGIVEDPARSAATLRWRGAGEAEIAARTAMGEAVLIEETWDPAWHAYENGKPLPLRAQKTMDFMLLDVPEGDHSIRLRFETPLENRIGQGLLALTAVAMAGLFLRR